MERERKVLLLWPESLASGDAPPTSGYIVGWPEVLSSPEREMGRQSSRSYGSRRSNRSNNSRRTRDSGGSSSSSSMAVELGREEASGAISPQALLDLTYETLYKSGRWNWLAGGVANRKEQRSSGARSFQNLDLANNAIYNVVEFNAPFGARGCISVRGEVNREDGSTLGVCFIESSVTLKGAPKVLGQEPPTITVPLPRPRGFVTTTYLDGDWRISRGSRSNVFLTVRTPRESRREGGEGGGKDEGPYT